MSVSTPPPEPPLSRQNLENSYPPFMPGVSFSSVYQRAGFDICLSAPRTPRSASPSSSGRSKRGKQPAAPWGVGKENSAPSPRVDNQAPSPRVYNQAPSPTVYNSHNQPHTPSVHKQEYSQGHNSPLPNNTTHNFEDVSFQTTQPLRISREEGYRSKKPVGLEVCTASPAPVLSAASESLSTPYPRESRLENPTIPAQRLSCSSSIYSPRNTLCEPPKETLRISRVLSFQRANNLPKLVPDPKPPILEAPEKDDWSVHSSSLGDGSLDTFGSPHTSLTSSNAGLNSFTSSADGSGHESPFLGKKICSGCDQRIVGKCLRSKDGAIPGHWHRECFKCSGCHNPLGCEILVYRHRPFCHECYLRLSEVICQACLAPVHGDCFETVPPPGERLDSEQEVFRYHTDCLRCCECDCEFDSSFLLCDGRVLCGAHARSRQVMF